MPARAEDSNACLGCLRQCRDHARVELRAPAALLEAGHVVIADRYLLATLAAMTRHGDGDLDWLRDLSRRLVRPDIWLLHAPATVTAERIRARAGERDVVLDAEAFDAGNRFGIEIARANSVQCIDTGAQPLASYLGAVVEDVTRLAR